MAKSIREALEAQTMANADGVSIQTSTGAIMDEKRTPVGSDTPDTLRGGEGRTLLDAASFREALHGALQSGELAVVVAKDGASKVARIFDLFKRSTENVIAKALDPTDIREANPTNYAKLYQYQEVSEASTFWKVYPHTNVVDLLRADELPDWDGAAKYGTASYKARLGFARQALKRIAEQKRARIVIRDAMTDAQMTVPNPVVPDDATEEQRAEIKRAHAIAIVFEAEQIASEARDAAATLAANAEAEKETPQYKAEAYAKTLVSKHTLDWCDAFADHLLICLETARATADKAKADAGVMPQPERKAA